MRWQSVSAFLCWMRDFYFPAIGDPMAARIDTFLGQRCEWELRVMHYATQCGKTCEVLDNDFNYCPYCGFPIRKMPDSSPLDSANPVYT